jgi:hypothetical protein
MARREWNDEGALFEMDSDRMTDFLRDNLGLYYCDDCLYEETRVKSVRRANYIRRRLLTYSSNYQHETTCDCCGRNKESIAFLGRTN